MTGKDLWVYKKGRMKEVSGDVSINHRTTLSLMKRVELECSLVSPYILRVCHPVVCGRIQTSFLKDLITY